MKKSARDKIKANIDNILVPTKQKYGWLLRGASKEHALPETALSQSAFSGEEMADSLMDDQQSVFDNFKGDSKSAAMADEVVGRFLGQPSQRAPLFLHLPVLEKIKIYAREGFINRCEGSEEEFERLWQEAFPIKKKGSKK